MILRKYVCKEEHLAQLWFQHSGCLLFKLLTLAKSSRTVVNGRTQLCLLHRAGYSKEFPCYVAAELSLITQNLILDPWYLQVELGKIHFWMDFRCPNI